MSINWYPGHMVKAKREIKENIKLVDMVIILLDARAPFSCRNRDLEEMLKDKSIILVLNKKDLAHPAQVKEYQKDLEEEGFIVGAVDSLSGNGVKDIVKIIRNTYKPMADRMLERGRRVRPARIMIAGVPNIGKSTFLNGLVGKKMAKTGPKPGVTRGKQWVRVREDMDFLDTPGLMWPKIESPEQGFKLALLDIVGENAYAEGEVALFLIDFLREKAPQELLNKFKLDDIEGTNIEVLEKIARQRGHLAKGGELDLDITAKILLQEFRRGHIAKICLD